ncbi:MAG TPA: caspase family protein [Burkholderiaceae bacterium]|nr:caspase family protein [Burkholderiaceae bacterium]
MLFLAGQTATVAAQASSARTQERPAASRDTAAQKRIALVVGNGSYPSVPLPNPVNDARLVSGNLRKLGFQVDEHLNLGVREFRRVLRDFARKTNSDSDGVAVFYYAGHGMQIDGRNYLLPVDLNLRDQEEVKDDSIDIEDIFISRLDQAAGKARVVILDACRDNPFGARTRNIRASAGLAEMAARGTLIAYASAPGAPAEDGPAGTNSLYTRHLVDEMMKPGLEIEQMFKNVRVKVLRDTNQRQVPWVNTSLTVNFSFNPAPADPTQPDAARLARVDRLEAELEQTRRQLEAAQREARSPASGPAANAAAAGPAATPAPIAAADAVRTADAVRPADGRGGQGPEPDGPGIARHYPGWDPSGALPYNNRPVGGGIGYGGLPRYLPPPVAVATPRPPTAAEQFAAGTSPQIAMPDLSHLSPKERERRCTRLQARAVKSAPLSPLEMRELAACRR